MIIRRKVNDGEWEEIEVEFGVLEDDDWDELDDDDDGGIEPLLCDYCSSPATAGYPTCGRSRCVEAQILSDVMRGALG